MICLYFPVRRSSATMSRMKSEGLSVSVVIVTSKAIGERADRQLLSLRCLGSARGPRAGFGVAPKQSLATSASPAEHELGQSPRSRDALASTRAACAPQTLRIRSRQRQQYRLRLQWMLNQSPIATHSPI